MIDTNIIIAIVAFCLITNGMLLLMLFAIMDLARAIRGEASKLSIMIASINSYRASHTPSASDPYVDAFEGDPDPNKRISTVTA